MTMRPRRSLMCKGWSLLIQSSPLGKSGARTSPRNDGAMIDILFCIGIKAVRYIISFCSSRNETSCVVASIRVYSLLPEEGLYV